MLPRLVTIPISHYGERARWALDLVGVDYEEIHHLQMFSWVAARWHRGRRTLPILRLPDGGALTDSAEIVRWADARTPGALLPRDAGDRARCDDLSRRFANEYGVHTRRVVYDWSFRSVETTLPYNFGRAPAWQTVALRVALPVAERVLGRVLDLSPDMVTRAFSEIDRTMDDVAEMLSDGRPFLLGDRFTAADLTFAAMTAPSVLPDRYGVRLPHVEEIPDDAARRVTRWREHPAGRFALRLYEGRPAVRARFG